MISRLPATDAPRVVDVLCEAFREYPVMRFVLGEDSRDYQKRLTTLIGFFVSARALRDEPMFGVAEGAELHAAATTSFPDLNESPAELVEFREGVWRELGSESRARYEACGVAWASFAMAEPHFHVNMIGVRDARRGLGLGKRLLEHVHGLSSAADRSIGVTLTTEDPANVPFYQHLGYEVVGWVRIAPELETWALFRENRPREEA